jgi:hypothetical protein
MKKALVTLGLVAVGAVFALPASSAPAPNPVVNPGFEQGCPPDGPPTGWTVEVTGGSWTQTNGPIPDPFEGNCSAIGVTDGPGVFQTMSSTPMNLGAGQTLTGWARFLDGEEGGFPCVPGVVNDVGEVRLLRIGPTPAFQVARHFESNEQGLDSGWVKWTGKTFSSGAWVIQYRVRNADDDICDSALMADANGLGSVSVGGPKP